jgi:hypothetical protein
MTDSFDPVTSRDYVPELVTGYKQINEGMANYWDQEIDNYNYAASFAGDNLKILGEMSETVSGILKQREDKKRQEDFAKGYMWLYENGISNEAMAAYNEATEELYEEGRVVNEMRTDWESRGGDIWNSVEFKKLNKAEQHGAVVAFVESKLQQYSPSTNEAMQNATSYEEYKAAESVARLNLYRQLGDINPALVNKHVFEGQRRKEDAAYNNWYTKREAEIKEQELVDAKKTLTSCAMTSADGVNCIMNYANNYAGLYGGIKGKARREALGHLKDLASSGVLSEAQTDKMLDMEFVHADGHTTTFRQQYPAEANDLEDAVDDYATKKYNREQNERQLNAHNETQEFIKSIPAEKISEKGYSLEIIKQAQALQTQQKMKYNGHSDPYLETMISSLREDENIIKSRKLDAEQAFLDGELNSETLKEYPIMVQLDPQIQKKAKAGDTVIVGGKEYLNDLESMVKKAAKLTAGGYDDGANQLSRYFQAKWQKRAIEIHEALPEGEKHKAGQMAFDEIKADFEFQSKQGASISIYQDDRGNFVSPNVTKADELADTSKLIDKAIQKENYYLKSMGVTALDSPRLFFSEQELIDIQNNSATQGILVIPEKAKRIAKKFDNLNAIDVINRQRASLGMEPLTSDSLKAYDGLPTESKFLLNYSATSMTSARAWGTYGENVEALAPKGILDTLDNGLDFGHKMATYETGLLLDDLGIKFDSTDELYKILSDEQKDDYNRFLYKYSGGTDKYALKNLIIEGLEKDVENKSKKK